jgi:hypothetical protein
MVQTASLNPLTQAFAEFCLQNARFALDPLQYSNGKRTAQHEASAPIFVSRAPVSRTAASVACSICLSASRSLSAMQRLKW